jgi:hypothetical protein
MNKLNYGTDITKSFGAKAAFIYTVGAKTDSIEVGAKASKSRSADDWKINLALQAGQQIAEELNTGISSIQLSMGILKLIDIDE